jgi:hypothetical protein
VLRTSSMVIFNHLRQQNERRGNSW